MSDMLDIFRARRVRASNPNSERNSETYSLEEAQNKQ